MEKCCADGVVGGGGTGGVRGGAGGCGCGGGNRCCKTPCISPRWTKICSAFGFETAIWFFKAVLPVRLPVRRDFYVELVPGFLGTVFWSVGIFMKQI